MSLEESARRSRPIIASALLLVAIVVAAAGWLDDRGAANADAVFKTALATFAVARGLDAAVSMAQGTEIAMQPAGIGLTVSAGELLDPVNDLIEQFSWIMLVSTTSLGIQSVLLRVTRWPALTFVFAVVAIGRLLLIWRPNLVPEPVAQVLKRVLLVALLVRFALPVYALASTMFFDLFLDPTRVVAVGVIEEATGDIREIEQIERVAGDDERSWRQRVSEWFATTVDTLDIQARLEAFRDRVGATVEHLVSLIVVFTLQTVLLPLAFLWMLPRLLAKGFERLL